MDAEAAAIGGDIGKVQVDPFCELFALLGGEDFLHVLVHFGVAQVAELDRQQLPPHPQHGRYAHGQMDV